MFRLLSTTSRIALVAVTACAALPSPVALAADVTIVNGQTQTINQSVTDSDHLTIESGGAITGSVVWTGTSPAALIDNYGTMGSDTSSTRAFSNSSLSTNPTAPNITINNHSTGVIQSTGDAMNIGNAIGTSTIHGSVILNNDGLIETYGSNQAIDFDKATNGTVTINNSATGRIIGTAGTDTIRPGQNATVNNYGLIRNGDDEFDFGTGGDGVDFQNNSGGAVNNYSGGTIEGDKHAVTGKLGITVNNHGTLTGRNGSGINIDNDATVGNTVYVNNYAGGIITGEAVDSTSDDADGDAIDADGLVNVQNYGLIQGLGASGIHDGQVNVSQAIAAGGGIIYSYAGATIHSVQTAIQVDDSNLGPAFAAVTITNEGTIRGDDGTAINIIGVQDDTITNKGAIFGDIHMDLGQDTLNEYAGASIAGLLDGGNGIDTVNLYGTSPSDAGTLGNVQNFDMLNVKSGKWTLTDDQSYSEGTTVFDGATLRTDYDLIGKMTVNAGGTLEGNGTFTELNAYDSSGADPNKFITIAPGDGPGSIGTMHIDTDGVMEHTNYDVDVDAAGHSDLIHAAGGFTILTYPDTYDHVVVTAAPGAYAASTTYTILTADGGVGGTFTDVADNMAFLDASLSYDVNDVYLTLTRNDIALWDVAETPNQNAVAHAVGEFAPSTLHDEIVTLSADDARSAYDSLSGEVHASVGSVLSGQTALVDDTIRSRFAVAFGSGDETPLAFGDDVKSGTNAADKAIAPKPLVSAWAQGFGQWTDADGDGNAAGVESNVGGLLAGVDGTFGNVTIGIAGGYASASTDVADRKSSANSSTGLLAAYAGTDLGPIGLRGGASYGWTQVDTSRVTTVGNITEHPKASYDGGIGNVFVEAARLVRLAGIGFEPFAGIAWTNVDLDGFTETNAPLTGLTSDGQSFDSLYSTLGLRAASNFALGNRFLFRQHAMLGWRHAFGDVTPDMTMSLAETGADFTVQGLPIASDSAVIEAGVDLALGGGASLDLSYAGNISADASAHAVKLTGAVNF